MGKSRVPGGYVDVPRYLYDALLGAPGLSAAQLKVVLVIVRLTWGFYPDKNRGGARISRRTLAKYAGLSRRTVDNVTPPLIRAGIVEQVSAAAGTRGALIRLNPNPELWGRFVPVGYSAVSTLDGFSTGTLAGPCSESTQSTDSRVPRVLDHQGSTGSHVLPSLELPSDELPSPKSPINYDEIESPLLRRFMERAGQRFFAESTETEAP